MDRVLFVYLKRTAPTTQKGLAYHEGWNCKQTQMDFKPRYIRCNNKSIQKQQKVVQQRMQSSDSSGIGAARSTLSTTEGNSSQPLATSAFQIAHGHRFRMKTMNMSGIVLRKWKYKYLLHHKWIFLFKKLKCPKPSENFRLKLRSRHREEEPKTGTVTAPG